MLDPHIFCILYSVCCSNLDPSAVSRKLCIVFSFCVLLYDNSCITLVNSVANCFANSRPCGECLDFWSISTFRNSLLFLFLSLFCEQRTISGSLFSSFP